MFPVIFIGLCVAVLALLAAFTAAFLDVAFQDEQETFPGREAIYPVHLRHGAWLFGRHVQTRNDTVGRRGQFTSQAISTSPARTTSCPWQNRGPVPVTASETMAVSSFLKTSRSCGEVERIWEQAQASAEAVAGKEPTATELPCPLMAADGTCTVYAVRPRRCRPANETKEDKADVLMDILDATAHCAGCGTDAARGKGQQPVWDTTTYELNSALAVALAEPNAWRRWSKGEAIFEGCRRCP